MRAILAVLVLYALTLACAAQSGGTLSGEVTFETTKGPVHNASILIVQLGRSALTDAEGRYSFQEVPPGRYEVLAHMHPLSDARKTVEIVSAQRAQANFSLRLAPVHEEITVTAGREQTTLEAFQSIRTVEALDLTTRPTASLGEALEHETGVAKRSFGPGSGRPVIRGFDGDRVLILQDGMPTGTLSSQSGDHGEPVDASSLDRIEVVRGPATLLYGSNAIGGVVNALTSHHQIHEHAHPGARGFITGSAGSGNALGGANAGFDVGLGRWMLSGAGGGLRTGDFETPLGVVENSHTRLAHSAAGIARYGGRGFFHITYGLNDGRYGVPSVPELAGEPAEAGHEREGPVDLKWRRQNLRLTTGFHELPGAVERLNVNLNYSDWQHREMVEEDPHTRFSNKQFGYRGVFEQRRRGMLSGSFGFSGLVRRYRVQGEEALAPPVGQSGLAVFGLEEFGLERLRFQLGGRLENNRYSPDGLLHRSFTGVSGSAGVNARLWRDGALVASYTNSYRAPALEELYNIGAHPGNLAFEVGDPNLERERSQGVEISLRHGGSRLRGEANFFRYSIDNYVFLERTGEIDHGLLRALYRQADARYQGGEARLDYALRPDLWINLGVDSVHARLTAADQPLPRIPPLRGRVGFDARYKGLSVRPELVLADAQEDLYVGESRTAGYGLVDVLASYTIVRAHALHSFSATLFNAGNTLYRNHVSLIKDFVPEIGRGVRFGYTVRFF